MADTIAGRLRRAREMSSLSARALSALAGLSAPHVSLIEAGQPSIKTETAEKLARVLGISLDWLVSGVGLEPNESDVLASVKRTHSRTEFSDDRGDPDNSKPRLGRKSSGAKLAAVKPVGT